MYSYLPILCALASFCSAVAQPEGGLTLAVERAQGIRSLSRRDQGTTEVEAILNGTRWVTSITIGGQALRVEIDTGSNGLWVLSTTANATIQSKYNSHRFYNTSTSHTFHLESRLTWNTTFNKEFDVPLTEASGLVGSETIGLGNATVTSVLFGLATSVESTGPGDLVPESDGTIGLGLSQNPLGQGFTWLTQGKPVSEPTFLQSIQNQIPEPIFTCNFRTNQAETISFGFVNSNLYTGTLNELAVDNSTGAWLVDDVQVSSNNKKLGASTGVRMLFDTSAGGTLLDPSGAADYYSLVPGSGKLDDGMWLFPCNVTTLPDLTMTFSNGATALLPGSALNESTLTFDGITCIGGVQQSLGVDLVIGNAFFGKYFTVWNATAPSISFAPYSDVEDTSGLNVANLPTATDAPGAPAATGTSSTSAASSPSPTKSGADDGLKLAVRSAYQLLLGLFAVSWLV